MTDIPERLRRLPVAKQIDSIDFDAKAFVACAQTGSGKTLVLPPTEAAMRKGDGTCVLLRQPTRLTTTFVYSGLKEFWPDLKVGISTSDDKENIDDADIIVFSDGSLSGLLQKRQVSAIYFDEAHLLPVPAELDLAIAKRKGLRVRCLSATIDPEPLAAYLGGAKIYTLEGRTFPIDKDVQLADPRRQPSIYDRDDHESLYEALDEHVAEAKFDDDGLLVFMPTKKMAQEAAEHFASDLPTAFAHGEVRPTETEKFCNEHAGSAFAVFATTAASAGITIDVGRVVILDQAIDSEVRGGVEKQFSTPVGDNSALQMAGRAGRIKPGKAILLTTDRGRDWADIAPRPIVGGCSKSTPYNVILALAAHGIHRDQDIDLYSKLDEREMRHARDELGQMGCLSPDGHITRLGRAVGNMPLEPHMAHMVLTAPGKGAKLVALAAILAAEQGTYQLVNVKPGKREHRQTVADDPDFSILPKECVVYGSAPMTLASILRQSFVEAESKNRAAWCRKNNLNERVIGFLAQDFRKAAKFLSDSPVSDFTSIDFTDELREAVDAHISGHRTMRRLRMDGMWGRIFMPQAGSLGCVIDSVLLWAWNNGDPYVGEIAGMPKIVRSQAGSTFVSLGMPIFARRNAP